MVLMPIYIEVKQASLSAKSWGMIFNDTSEEKAEAFMGKKNVFGFECRIDIPNYRQIILPLCQMVKSEFKKNGIISANSLLKNKLKYYNDEMLRWIKNYSIVDENGDICFAKDLSTPSRPHDLDIPEINIHLPALKTRGWSSKEKFIQLYHENKLIFKDGRPYEKHLLIDSKDSAMSILNFYSRQGKHDLEKLGLGHMFKTAKPVQMIKYFIKLCTSDDDVVMDYFAGSGTTAQAVIECNLEDGCNRRFLLCQIAEPIKNNPEAIQTLLKYGYTATIDNIARLRLEILDNRHQHKQVQQSLF